MSNQLKLIISIFLSIIFALLFPTLAKSVSPIGTLFIKTLKLFSIPIIFISVMTGIFKLKTFIKLYKISKLIFIYSIITTSIAIIIGYFIGTLIPLTPNNTIIKQSLINLPYHDIPSLTTILVDIIPTNILTALAQGDILPIVFVSFLIGSACLSVRKQGTSFLNIIEAFDALLFTIISWLIKLIPFGIFFILTPRLSLLSWHTLSGLKNYFF